MIPNIPQSINSIPAITSDTSVGQSNLVQNSHDISNNGTVNSGVQAPLSPEVASFFQNIVSNNNVDDTNKTSTNINDIVFNPLNDNNQNM